MALPIWLTWNLQMPRSKKISILCLFATGVVCIIFACLRVIQVAVNASKPEAQGQPLDPTWLAIWGMAECAIGRQSFAARTAHPNSDLFTAVIIGCCPAFAVLVNLFRSKASYGSDGYQKQTESNAGRHGGIRMELRTIGIRGTREKNQRLGLNSVDLHWAGAHSSQEELRAKHDGIMISTSVTQGSMDTLEKW